MKAKNPSFRTRRQWLGMALGAGLLPLLPACSQKPAFNGIDITGADYAKDFSLPDQHGQVRTMADFKGKAVVVFFGYTQCPDYCPTAMVAMAEAKSLLGEDGARVQGIFVSVDPERDTPQVLKEYMESFDPEFVALRPTLEELPELAKHFRVYYNKVEGKTPTSYTMDHSVGSYVYDPQGRLRLFHRHGNEPAAMAEDIKLLLAGN